MLKFLHKYGRLLGAIAPLAMLSPALAQNAGPATPLRIIVPYAAGGGTDAVARTLADSLRTVLHRDVIIDNKPGAGGLLGLRALQSAKPDGDTLLLRDSGFVVAPMVQKAANYNPLTDIVPVASLARIEMLMMVPKEVPANNVAEFIAWAKNQPGGVNVANPGINTGGHMAGELFGLRTGVKVISIAYKGAAETGIALKQGDAKMQINVISDFVHGQIEAGNVKVIGVAANQPSEFAPGVGLVKDTVPNFSFEGFYGLLAAPGVPKDRLAVIEAGVKTALNDPKVRERFAGVYTSPAFKPGSELAKDMVKQQAFYRGVVQELKLEAQ